jgi:outer membrane protein
MILFLAAAAFALDLSYSQAMEAAIEGNQQLRGALLDIEAAQGSMLSAKGAFDPTFTGTVGRNVSSGQQYFAGFGVFNTEVLGPSMSVGMQSQLPTGTSLSADWSVSRTTSRFVLEGAPVEEEISPFDTRIQLNFSQPILQGFMLDYNMRPLREAKRSLDLAELQAEQTRQQVLSDVAKAYWNLHYQIQVEKLSAESIRIAEEEKRVILALVEQGNLAPVEADRVEAALFASRSSSIDAENAKMAATDNLLALLGLPLGEEVLLLTEPAAPIEQDWVLEMEVETARQQSLELQRLRLAAAAAESRLRDARHASLPNLSATVSYTLSGWEEELGTAIEEMLNGGLPGHFVGLNLSMPLGNWADKGGLAESIAQLEKARSDLDAMESSLEQRVRAQVRAIRSAAAKRELASANLELAKKTLETDRALRDAGRSIEKDVLDSLKSVENARAETLKSLSDYNLALIELALLKGQIGK